MENKVIHKELARGRWFEFSLCQQLANIGTEVRRANHWMKKDKKIFEKAVERALELFDLTLTDKRWQGGKKREIARLRELFCDAFFGGKEYATSFEDLERYFYYFVFAARRNI